MWRGTSKARRAAFQIIWGLAARERKSLDRAARNMGPDRWQRDLPADGDVERHPGPLWLATLNANSADYSFTALHHTSAEGYDVLALQEDRRFLFTRFHQVYIPKWGYIGIIGCIMGLDGYRVHNPSPDFITGFQSSFATKKDLTRLILSLVLKPQNS